VKEAAMKRPVDPDYASYVRSRQHALLRSAYLVCGDRALAEDLLQEALIKLALRWERVREDNPDGYLRTILYRDAVSAWRKRHREVVLDVVPDAPERVAGLAVDRLPERMVLDEALAALTARQRVIVVLRFYEDRSVLETADILGISDGTVKSQTHVALAHLRHLLPDLVTTEEES
jgi:RNA polymerase sigma-70 factor (sigma-E family)